MALDGVFLYTICRELQCIVDFRIEKIHQISSDEIFFVLKTRNETKNIIFSADANARVHLTNYSPNLPKCPTNFCMILRKYLSSAQIIKVHQDGLERILFVELEKKDIYGKMQNFTFVAEIMGKFSNIFLLQNGKILDCLKHSANIFSSQRLLLPGAKYIPPERFPRINFLEKSQKSTVFSLKEISSEKDILKNFEGVSPLLAREWIFFSKRNGDRIDYEKLAISIENTKDKILNDSLYFNILSDKNDIAKEFYCLKIHQYGSFFCDRKFYSASETLDFFYGNRTENLIKKQLSNDILKILKSQNSRILKRVQNCYEKLEECKTKDIFKLYGDLISANLWCIGNAKSVKLENFYDENKPILIELDERLTPAQNATFYYKKYKKLTLAEKIYNEQLKKAREELEYFDSVFDVLSRAKTNGEIELVRRELEDFGYIKKSFSKEKIREIPPIEYLSPDNFTILVGRNNMQNDQLTRKIAQKFDIWLHTKDIPSAHVIIMTGGRDVPKTTLEFAARLTAAHSKARDAHLVPVDYTLCKFVKKPNGAKPGMVIYSNQNTVFVKPLDANQ